MLHSDGESKIEILEFPEAVRKYPQMYIGSTDQQGLYRLLQLTVEHRLFHYDFLGQSLDTIIIRLEDDGSATVTSKAATVSEAFLEGNVQLLETKRRVKLFNLFIVAACCERLSVITQGANNQWRSLIFERGILRSDNSHNIPPEEGCEIWLRLWPDFTILEASVFDSQQTSALMQPFAESHPTVTITVIDARPQSI